MNKIFKTPDGKINWLNVILLIAGLTIIVTSIVIPVANHIKAKLPTAEEAETAATAARMLFRV